MRRKGSKFDFQDGESIQKTNVNPNICLIQPENVPRLESVSGWTKFQKRYGVEMSVKVPTNKMEADVKVPANKIEADVVNNNYEVSQHEVGQSQIVFKVRKGKNVIHFDSHMLIFSSTVLK